MTERPSVLRVLAALGLAGTLGAAVASPAGAQWVADGVPLTRAAANQIDAVAVSDGTGGAYVVWRDERTGDADIYAQHVSGAGVIVAGWPADGLGVCTVAGAPSSISATADGSGGLFVAWTDARNGNPDVFLARITAAGAPASGWPANGLAVCTAGGQQSPAVVAPDGAGGAFVAWSDLRSATADLYAQHVQAGGTIDPAWTANGNVVCNAARSQLEPAIVPDGSGGFVVAWNDGRGGSTFNPDADIYALRMTAAGAPATGWTANGVAVVVEPTSDQATPRLVPDGTGGAIVGWLDQRAGGGALLTNDLYALRLTGDGGVAPGWVANGTPVVTATGSQLGLAMVEDGAGGAIFVWQDGRDTSTIPTNQDIYALRLDPAGARPAGWMADGNDISPVSPERQREPAAVGDGAGGALVVWTDDRGSGDIYAQHVTAGGGPAGGWPAGGIRICGATLGQARPVLAPDGSGGAIAAWEDPRTPASGIDLYAQRFLGSGTVGPTVGVDPLPRAAGGIALAFAGAHPARGATAFAIDLAVADVPSSAVVYSPAGREVAVLWPAATREPGRHVVRWDDRGAGRAVPPGVYLLRVTAGPAHATLRFVALP